MNECDYFIFILSSDWVYLNSDRIAELRSLSASEIEIVKSISRKHAREIIKGVSSYFQVDFSKERIENTCRKFIEEIKCNVDSENARAVGDFLTLVRGAGEKYSQDLWLLRMAYEELCKESHLFSVDCGKTAKMCEIIKRVKFHDFSHRSLESDWDRWLSSFFEGNSGEIYDFYFSIVSSVSFTRDVAFYLNDQDDVDKSRLFEELERVIFGISGIFIGRNKILEMHETYWKSLPM